MTDEEIVFWVDPCIAWMDAHPEEVERYRGQYVAVHPTRGVICSASTFDEVYAVADSPEFGEIKDELLITKIGDGSAPVMVVACSRPTECQQHRAPDIGCRGAVGTCSRSDLAWVWTHSIAAPQYAPTTPEIVARARIYGGMR